MKHKSIHVDELIYAVAKERLAAAGWDDVDYAVEYFLAECVVRKKLPAFLRDNARRSCAVCKFYEPIHAKRMKEKMVELKRQAKSGKWFTALLHPAHEGGYWCEIPAFVGCVSQGSTLAEAKYMIKDAALGWLNVKEINLRYRVERESERDADLFVYNTPDAALKALKKDCEKQDIAAREGTRRTGARTGTRTVAM